MKLGAAVFLGEAGAGLGVQRGVELGASWGLEDREQPGAQRSWTQNWKVWGLGGRQGAQSRTLRPCALHRVLGARESWALEGSGESGAQAEWRGLEKQNWGYWALEGAGTPAHRGAG